MSRHNISDENWQRIESLICPPRTSSRGRPATDPRLIFNGILWILRTGSPWRDLLKDFGPWQTVYKRFNSWAKSPTLHNLLEELAKDADLESIMLDGSYVRVHQHASGGEGGRELQDIGRSRGGLTTKIHAVVDALGNPVRVRLTAGNVNDCIPALELIGCLPAKNVIADKAYDVQYIIDHILSQGSNPVIPPKKNRVEKREYDKHLYKERHLVENFFCKLKEFRRVATRYEKLAATFLAMVNIASCLIWLR